MKRRTVSLAPVFGTVELRAATAKPDARSIEATFYSGAPVLRVPLFDDPFELVFEMTAQAAKLDRLNAGAPLLDSHNGHAGVSSILGVVERAWLENGEGRATLRFSERAEVEPIWRDVLAGIIRHVSMGAFLHELEDVTPKGAKLKRMRATSWEPYEISLVPSPADAGARVHNNANNQPTHPCVIVMGANMDNDTTTTDTTGDERAELAQLREERRRQRIREIALHFGCGEPWGQQHVNNGTSVDEVVRLAAERRSTGAPTIDGRVTMGDDHDAPGVRVERMASALVARAMRTEPEPAARQFYGDRLVDLAFEILRPTGHARGLDPRHNGTRIVELALHATSDFPLLLENTMNKMLLPLYELAQPTYRMVAARKSFNDFRAHKFLRAGDFPVPMQVNEHGEFKSGTMSESREQVTLVTYGRILGLSRQVLVNDDLNAFRDLAAAAARRVLDFENATFFTICILAGSGLGPTLSDSNTVYHSNHANTAAAGALDVAKLGESRSKLMAQASLDGIKLNIPAGILLVSPTSLTLGEQLVAPLSPAQVSSVNPFMGKLAVLGDANLTGTRFYVLADPARGSNYVYGTLEGQTGPRIEVRNGFEIDGVEFKVALDFGCGAIDYRYGVTGAGA